jgi:hypothetical protein
MKSVSVCFYDSTIISAVAVTSMMLRIARARTSGEEYRNPNTKNCSRHDILFVFVNSATLLSSTVLLNPKDLSYLAIRASLAHRPRALKL